MNIPKLHRASPLPSLWVSTVYTPPRNKDAVYILSSGCIPTVLLVGLYDGMRKIRKEAVAAVARALLLARSPLMKLVVLLTPY